MGNKKSFMEKQQPALDQILETIRSFFDKASVPFLSRWLKISEACKYARMSKNTLMEYIKSGDIYATKKGGNWIVDRKSIDDFYDEDRKKMFALREKLNI